MRATLMKALSPWVAWEPALPSARSWPSPPVRRCAPANTQGSRSAAVLALTGGAQPARETQHIRRPRELTSRAPMRTHREDSRRARHGALRIRLLSAAVGLGLVLITVLEADGVWEFIGDAGEQAHRLIPQLGPGASVVAIYLEESGIPLPLPGDVFVLYLGHVMASSPIGLLVAWMALVAAVVAGSSNLYLISRHWGRRLVDGRLGALIHLTPERLATAERAFNRWGWLALVFGRHIVGLRVPLTVAAGVLRVPYRVFAASVAVSSAIWAAIWLAVGVRFGAGMAGFMHRHRWAYIAVPLAFWLIVLGLALGQRLKHSHRSSGKPLPN